MLSSLQPLVPLLFEIALVHATFAIQLAKLRHEFRGSWFRCSFWAAPRSARRTTMCCTPAPRRIPPALPTTSETVVDEMEGLKTIKQFGVRVFIIKKPWFANNSVEFGHRAANAWGFQCLVNGACASSVDAVLPLWSDGPPLPVIDRSPNPTILLARWQGTSAPSTKKHDVFSVQLARIYHDERITFAIQ